MRVVIDARAIAWTGIGRYILNLTQAFRKLASPPDYVLAVSERDRDLVRAEPHIVVSGSYYSWREQLVLGWKLRAYRADLWHFPHFNVPFWFDRPYVVTIHDTTRFFFPGQRQQGLWQQLMYEQVFARAVARARAVVAVSRTTAQALGHLPIRVPPITVIPEAVAGGFTRPASMEARAVIRERLSLMAPYLLFVGVWMQHKNIERLLRVFRLVRKTHPGLHLVVTGRLRPGYLHVPKLAGQLGLTGRVHFPGFVNEGLLPALYAEAAAFVFPSLYEGFGLPPLEAAAQGVPVIASAVSSVPEVMGRAAEYVNPEHVESIAAGVRRVLDEASYRRELIARGREQVARFSWEKIARATMRVYRQVC